ncbi:MAG: multicopper oxidase domain-containing protein, partial [Chitinophagaceae bacterium]
MKMILLLATTLMSWVLFHAFYLSGFEILSSPQTTLGLTSQTASLKRNAVACLPASAPVRGIEEISINDNRKPAGVLRNGILFLNLEVRTGNWYPETHDGMPIKVYALAEAGKPLQIPGPLIRVPEGTEIQATVRNAVAATTLMLHGFYSRPGNGKDSTAIPYGETYKVQFKPGVAGTYSYRVSANSFKRTNGLPYREDSQLYGGFIVDGKSGEVDPDERILMIGIWNDTLSGKFTFRGEENVINGLSWPYTERFTYRFGQKVNWRLINASNQQHPMHLHGFYYTVNSRGNEDSDRIYHKKDRRLVVTEPLQPGENLSMTWEPNREGNWLFHCHTLVHIT